MSELLAQGVRASSTDLYSVERHRFEPQPQTDTFYQHRLPFNLSVRSPILQKIPSNRSLTNSDEQNNEQS